MSEDHSRALKTYIYSAELFFYLFTNFESFKRWEICSYQAEFKFQKKSFT